ncbi:MAG: hypothetical protein IJL74_04205 [Bacilli bacterium]|nr:hypothetical protein [Bacilli bacterium]
MKDLLAKLFGVLKYVLLIISFGLIFFGIMSTYSRLNKSMTEAISVFLPFALVLIVFIVSMIMNSKLSESKLLFNFVSCLVFTVTIIIGLRSIFDKNMLLYYKYQVNFNPTFFADNLSAIEFMLYMIFFSNVILIICDLLNKGKSNN